MMIIEFSELSEGFFEEKFDYCIAGAGIAGIVLARELSKSGRVLLIEAVVWISVMSRRNCIPGRM